MRSPSSTDAGGETPPYADLKPVFVLNERKNKGWPAIWSRPDHPQWLRGVGEARNRREAFVYICDDTEQGMKDSLKLGATMEAPGLGDDAMDEYGTRLLSLFSRYISTLFQAHSDYPTVKLSLR